MPSFLERIGIFISGACSKVIALIRMDAVTATGLTGRDSRFLSCISNFQSLSNGQADPTLNLIECSMLLIQ